MIIDFQCVNWISCNREAWKPDPGLSAVGGITSVGKPAASDVFSPISEEKQLLQGRNDTAIGISELRELADNFRKHY